MTDQQHPITPPAMLVASLRNSAPHGIRDAGVTREIWLIHNAFAAGADHELEACCEYIAGPGKWFATPQFRLAELRAARRPKPPSLAEQALKALDKMNAPLGNVTASRCDTIRRALERLQELESND